MTRRSPRDRFAGRVLITLAAVVAAVVAIVRDIPVLQIGLYERLLFGVAFFGLLLFRRI